MLKRFELNGLYITKNFLISELMDQMLKMKDLNDEKEIENTCAVIKYISSTLKKVSEKLEKKEQEKNE